MTATRCPAGHLSTTSDWCDECGAALSPSAPPPAPAPVPPPPVARACAHCGEPRSGRFCEACGWDADLPAPPPPPPAPPPRTWTAVVRADREWFDEVVRREGPDAGTLQFPPFVPERRFALTGAQLTIGRRSRSRGIDPEIDLSGPPTDPGVSALHAVLLAQPDGTWHIVDLDSTNGTTVGRGTRTIPPNTGIPLADGGVVRLGAWTTITILQSR